MKRTLLVIMTLMASRLTSATEPRIEYPRTERVPQVDDYHGTKVEDPYRWLEDAHAPATKTWVDAQNKVTFGFLEGIEARPKLRARLEQLYDYEKFGIPAERGGRFFYTYNTGLQNQAALYVADSLEAEPRLLLDPNTLSADGTVALADYDISDDGKFLAYGLSMAGSDWQEWRVRDVATGKDTSDLVKWVKFSSASWTADGKGFYYSRYDEPREQTKLEAANYFQKLFFHQLGTPQSEDKLVYERPDEKTWGFRGEVSEDGKYLVVQVWRSTERKNQLFYQDLTKPDAPMIELLTGFDAEYVYLGNDGTMFYLQTDNSAPKGRVIAVDLAQPAPEHWREVVAEGADALEYSSIVGDSLFISYLHDASSQIKQFDLQGKPLRTIELPGIGTVVGFGGQRDDEQTFYSFASYTTPSTIYRYDLADGESKVYRQPKTAFNSADYETRQVFYPSRDGTKVPMFLISKKGLKPSPDTPTLLYGYGGFDISLTPSFSPSTILWTELGGLYAVANLRGGGEYGREWHEAGMKDRKQNVFDDFISAAEWLQKEGYTSPDKLAITGRSNGGLLVGACMTQRPDLYAAAIPGVGVLDMLRFHRFTIGWAWVSEYGSADEAGEFPALLAYSPLHNLKPGTSYPATMIVTADHDDRVVPAHSFKFAAALQAAQSGEKPTLIRIETSAGHGAGKPTSKIVDENADIFAFLMKTLKMNPPAAR